MHGMSRSSSKGDSYDFRSNLKCVYDDPQNPCQFCDQRGLSCGEKVLGPKHQEQETQQRQPNETANNHPEHDFNVDFDGSLDAFPPSRYVSPAIRYPSPSALATYESTRDSVYERRPESPKSPPHHIPIELQREEGAVEEGYRFTPKPLSVFELYPRPGVGLAQQLREVLNLFPTGKHQHLQGLLENFFNSLRHIVS